MIMQHDMASVESLPVAAFWEWPERERKFVISGSRAAELLAAVGPFTQADVHDPQRPAQWTKTTYLDTGAFSYFRSTGRDRSRRVRIREYATARDERTAPVLTGQCWLELKESLDGQRAKYRSTADPAAIHELVVTNGESWVGTSDPDAPALSFLRARLREDRPRPQVTTWYRRIARRGENGLRISLDLCLSFARPEPIGLRGMPAEPLSFIHQAPFQILELKYRGEAPVWLERALRGIDELHGFSKFRAAMLRCVPGVEGVSAIR